MTSKGKGDTHVVAFYDNGVAVTQVILPVSDKVGPNYPDVPTPTKVDELVVAKLTQAGDRAVARSAPTPSSSAASAST